MLKRANAGMEDGEDRFCDRLRNARLRKHMTLKKLAEKSGSHSSTVHAWERGERYPNVYYLKNLCLALEVSADELIGLDESSEERRKNNV